MPGMAKDIHCSEITKRLLPVTRTHPLRFFPTEGKGAVTIVQPMHWQGSESPQFLEAVGKTRIANFARSYKSW